MKHILILTCLLTMLSSKAQEVSFMTYNIKLDYPKEGDNNWQKRKPMLLGQLLFYEPDILGVQEAMPNQMKDIDSLLINYNFIGVGRDDGKDKGEYSAIFYNQNKIEVLTSSTFWLSQTPNEVSMGWDANYNRVCTYGLFQDKLNGEKFWVFNTHFDHEGIIAQAESAKLIIKKVKEINVEDYPVVLMGDFNMEETNKSIQLINNYLHDSKSISKSTPFGPSGTFNGFNFNQPVVKRIDYIFLSSEIEVDKYAILSDSKGCKYPSDHLPVYILATIK